MKDRHIRLELSQEPALSSHAAGRVRAVGWDWAARCMDLQLYRVRENDHPDFGGIEIEIAGVRMSDE